ncbi:MAG TPA: hypothetical protein VN282_11160 [Pyrinomonadaceae bacterium]|nr:hypothetical protein [Pyrinomonadaceae bacterium]
MENLCGRLAASALLSVAVAASGCGGSGGSQTNANNANVNGAANQTGNFRPGNENIVSPGLGSSNGSAASNTSANNSGGNAAPAIQRNTNSMSRSSVHATPTAEPPETNRNF